MGHMKDMFTLAGQNRTVVARDVALGTAAIKGHTADSTDVVVGDIPFPDCHGVDAFEFDLHCRGPSIDERPGRRRVRTETRPIPTAGTREESPE